MKARDWLNNNSAVVTIVAVVVLVISLGVIIMNTRGRGPSGPIDIYYFDLNTGKLFVAKSNEIPPIAAPSQQSGADQQAPNPKSKGAEGGLPPGQPAGVRAYVYACGSCPNVNGMTIQQAQQAGAYIAYLEMYTPQGKRALTQAMNPPKSADGKNAPAGPPPMAMMDPMSQTLVKRPQDKKWHKIYDQAGYTLTEQSIPKCPAGQEIKSCRP